MTRAGIRTHLAMVEHHLRCNLAHGYTLWFALEDEFAGKSFEQNSIRARFIISVRDPAISDPKYRIMWAGITTFIPGDELGTPEATAHYIKLYLLRRECRYPRYGHLVPPILWPTEVMHSEDDAWRMATLICKAMGEPLMVEDKGGMTEAEKQDAARALEEAKKNESRPKERLQETIPKTAVDPDC